ncbi:hypothetical protein CLU79DRAFT_694856 [Phycomyces nitens]|nr:hypothetical protein CLU79DRAFT_694856 [Phycomyces nitens]
MSDDRKLANILEAYFSDANLLWDKVMQSKISSDPNGFVSFASLEKLPRFKKLNANAKDIKQAAINHSLSKLKLNSSQDSIGRVRPFVANKKEELDDWSIYVASIQKPYHTQQSIKELFGSLIGPVSFVRFPENQNGHAGFYGFCFVEFDDCDNVAKAVRLLNRYEPNDKLSLRVMSKQEWNKLKEEYIEIQNARKAYVKEQWAEYNASIEDTRKEDLENKHQQPQKPQQLQQAQQQRKPELPEKIDYVKGIIVYVGNIHPKSSKTVISKLLEKSGVSVPYIGRKKGLDYCHARLNSPEDALELTQYFNNHPIIQETHTDTSGKPADENDSSQTVKLRVLTGKEEEFYWQDDVAGSKKLFA